MLVPDQTCHPIRSRWNEVRQVVRARYHRKFAAEIRAVLPFLPPEGTYFDIGANHGRFALELSRVHDGDCWVHSFEPLRYNNRILRQTIARQMNIVHHEHGLSDRSSRLDLFVPLRSDGTFRHGSTFVGSLAEMRQDRIDGPHNNSERDHYCHQPMITRTCDAVVDELRLERLDFIKIDVEGHEAEVITGAKATLDRYKPSILMEVRGGEQFDATAKLLGILWDSGYRLFDLDNRFARWSDTPDTLIAGLVDAAKNHDVLCWHPAGPVGGDVPPPFGINLSRTRFGR